jgi:hypothetical protein
MSSSPKQYRLDEIGGSDFASLAAARRSTADLFSDVLTTKIRAMLQSGDLTVENGVIVPARSRKGL